MLIYLKSNQKIKILILKQRYNNTRTKNKLNNY